MVVGTGSVSPSVGCRSKFSSRIRTPDFRYALYLSSDPVDLLSTLRQAGPVARWGMSIGEIFVARRSDLAPRARRPHNRARSAWAGFPKIQAIFTHPEGSMPMPCMRSNPVPRPGVTPWPSGLPLQVVRPASRRLPSRRRIALLPASSSVTTREGGTAGGGGG